MLIVMLMHSRALFDCRRDRDRDRLRHPRLSRLTTVDDFASWEPADARFRLAATTDRIELSAAFGAARRRCFAIRAAEPEQNYRQKECCPLGLRLAVFKLTYDSLAIVGSISALNSSCMQCLTFNIVY